MTSVIRLHTTRVAHWQRNQRSKSTRLCLVDKGVRITRSISEVVKMQGEQVQQREQERKRRQSHLLSKSLHPLVGLGRTKVDPVVQDTM